MKIPKARKLDSGTWFIQLRLNGESISVTARTEDQCVAKAMAVKSGLAEAKGKEELPTLKEAIRNYMALRSNTRSPSTLRGYEIILKTRFQKYMGKNLSEFTAGACKTMVNAEAPLCSTKTLKNSWCLVSAVIYETTGKRIHVDLPQVVTKEKPFLDYKQIETFVGAIHGTTAEIPAMLALSSMRRSEIVALDWGSIDLDRKIIRVEAAKVYGTDRKFVKKKATKNRASTRNVPIMMPQLQKALEAVEDKTGPVVKEYPETLAKQVNRICSANGLPNVGMHGLRHSFASLAYHLNIPEKIAMEIGGWSDSVTMRKIYTHIANRDIEHFGGELEKFYEKIANENAN